ncbi:uncharacterized protein BJ212DRAFT_1486077 [Suillus subaureus]|uniref:Myb/SANT-like domain-containing protein n=1 Tax=Suillus subaureus TaxID=48587 RepID=A0A9P7DY17_9AGAM|nr:uncharacterized protein BJ212DRAFT_1486077 [Suillus subaureus]KAG1805935.1 hypothetical protein BJ212DRAFT_1486077 [Suillus subaureus]
MAQKDDNKLPKAHWNDAEVDEYLKYLITQKSKIAGTSFKDDIYYESAIKIAGLRTLGPPKTGPHCKMKWQSLKQTHNTIERYQNSRSGCHWDNENGTNIQEEAAETQWQQFINASPSNKTMKPFKNAGWRFWLQMLEIMPNGSGTEGTATYNLASLATQASEYITEANTEASGSAVAAASTKASSIAMGLAISMPGARNDTGSKGPAAAGFAWDQVMSTLPSTNPGIISSSSMNPPPPPPSSVAASNSSTRKHSHSDMLFSSSTTQTSLSQMDSPTLNKKPKLSVYGGSTMSHVTGQCSGSKAAKDTASTAAFMNLQGSINHLMGSLGYMLASTDESCVLNERSQALAVMQDDECILLTDKVTLMNVFARSLPICATYLSSKLKNHLPYLQSVIYQAARGDYGLLSYPTIQTHIP